MPDQKQRGERLLGNGKGSLCLTRVEIKRTSKKQRGASWCVKCKTTKMFLFPNNGKVTEEIAGPIGRHRGALKETFQTRIMLSLHKGCLVVLVLVICSTLYMYYRYYWSVNDDMLKLSRVTDKPDAVIPNKVFKAGIMFLESTDNLKLMPLAMCSVESAARLNPDKQIYYFMKGFSGNLSQYPETEYRGIHLLSKMKNIVILPLKPIELFKDTPLESWYQKVNPEREKYWAHVLADGCRLALLWKYGGIYLDTDIISLRSLLFDNFTCLESTGYYNNAALGFHQKNHDFIWNCFNDFVANYDGDLWGQQGPRLITRVLKRWCNTDDLIAAAGSTCNGISLLNLSRFYPVPYSSWEKFYAPWKKEDIEHTFSATYGVHIWNFMNSDKKRKVVAGSGSLIEYFFRMHCPTANKLNSLKK